MPTLHPADWLPRAAAHERRVDTWVGPHLQRRRRGEKHPVEDFLFDYYHLSPARLRRWSPGLGTVLLGTDAISRYADLADWTVTADGLGATPDPARVARHSRRLADVRRLLQATAGRAPSYGCFGLHEWAMVYRLPPDAVRHEQLPLRLGSAGTDAVVEGQALRCTHVDAFRFFTDEAVPRNATVPTRESQPRDEQPGCLHAGMDLYRWAALFAPFVPGELVADCFAHAREIREVDMRASPYDLSGLGHRPIAVETPEGRAEYVRHQRVFAERGAVLRERLLVALGELTAVTDPGAETTTAGPQRGPAVGVGAQLARDLACLDAGGAHVELLGGLAGLADHGAHRLDVGVPAALRAPVRVGDAVTEARTLAADVAVGSHGEQLLDGSRSV